MGVLCSIERKLRSWLNLELLNERIPTKYTCIMEAYEIIYYKLALLSILSPNQEFCVKVRTYWAAVPKSSQKCELLGTLTLKVRTF